MKLTGAIWQIGRQTSRASASREIPFTRSPVRNSSPGSGFNLRTRCFVSRLSRWERIRRDL
jgi:hypothetical protein